MKRQIGNFLAYKLKSEQLKQILGGSGCSCHQAAPYACETAGYVPGSSEFNSCLRGTYRDCCALDTTCYCPPGIG